MATELLEIDPDDAVHGASAGPSFGGEGFQVDVDVYAGPLDLLLDLVQRKKIDVSQVPVLAIVEQFLSWVRTAMDARLELAADWLLMAATLAFLKSRLLLPASREDKVQAEATVEDFMARLRRVQAVRDLAEALGRRRRLGVHWHEPREAASLAAGKRLETTLHAMLTAYVREARATLRPAPAPVRKPHVVHSVDDAIRLVAEAVKRTPDWVAIYDAVPGTDPVDAVHARSLVASTYVASLELSKRGVLEVRQAGEAVDFRAVPGAR